MDAYKNNFKKLYELTTKKDAKINAIYSKVKTRNSHEIDEFLKFCGLESDEEIYLAAASRIVSLRADALIETLKQRGMEEEKIKKIKKLAYIWVKDFYIQHFEDFIHKIEDANILTTFNMELIKGVHKIGIVMSDWQIEWTAHIIENINEKLSKLDEPFNMLKEKGFLDKNPDGSISDRCYSVLDCDDGDFVYLSYGEKFTKYTNEISRIIDTLIIQLQANENDCKEAYVKYFKELKEAFCEEDTSRLIQRWQDVERAWMQIKSPLQVGHPLEYYEDHYRKAVALEWDIRFQDPSAPNADEVMADIKRMFAKVKDDINYKDNIVYNKCLQNLDNVQLYIGRPLIYYGAEFDGLFSAQVVPNDETVSLECGKKIFAFADNILDGARSKPFLKFHNEIFGKEFLDFTRELIFKKEELWHRVYQVSTIGHEFGHVLWSDEDSESVMNVSGNFKNIEEFKATTGGLMAYFYSSQEDIWEHLMADVIKRAVGLISWKQTAEVQAYYCEGLIHLAGLFETEVLRFNDKLCIDRSKEAYERLKQWYKTTYMKLALIYLDKLDASEFLFDYAVKKGGYFVPKDEKIAYFVEYYWTLYKSQGRVIDDESSPVDWI